MSKAKRNRPDKDGADRSKFDYYKARIKAMHPPCAICGLPINYSLPYTSPWSFTLDHIIPISKGGLTSEDNVQAAHRKCNRAKGEKLFLSPEEIYKLRLAQGATFPAVYSEGEMIGTTRGGTPCPTNEDQLIQINKGLPQSVNWRTY